MSNRNILLDAAITTTAVAYSIGDSIGGIIKQLPGGGRSAGTIVDVHLVDTLAQNPALTLLFFSQSPSSGTYTDNAAVSVAVADIPYYVGSVSILAADWNTVASKGFVGISTQVDVRWFVPRTDDGAMPYLYMVIVSGGTPTYGANATSLFVTLGLSADKP